MKRLVATRLEPTSNRGTSRVIDHGTMIEDPIEAFRSLSPKEQVQEGEDSLLSHILEKAIQAHRKYSGMGMDKMDTFLIDSECLRFPTRYVFEFGADMAPHQFAQPEPDYRSERAQGKVIYLRPPLRDRPDLATLAIAYMVPVINYGEIARDEHCIVYASALLGLTEDECYERLCELAALTGAETKYPECGDVDTVVESTSCGCGGGFCEKSNSQL